MPSLETRLRSLLDVGGACRVGGRGVELLEMNHATL